MTWLFGTPNCSAVQNRQTTVYLLPPTCRQRSVHIAATELNWTMLCCGVWTELKWRLWLTTVVVEESDRMLKLIYWQNSSPSSAMMNL